MSQSKKMLFVIDQISTGGAEKILMDFKEYVLCRDYDVQIFCLYGFDKQGKNSNIKYGLNTNSTSVLGKVIQQIILFFKLQFYALEVRPNCIFSFLERSNILVQSIFYRKVKILTVHNLLSIQYEKIENRFIRKKLLSFIRYFYNKKRTRIIAVSSQVKDDLVHNLKIQGCNVAIINNGVDKKYIYERSLENITEFSLNNKSIYLLNIGRFTLQKSQNKLIKLISLLRKEGYDVRLILIGEGELKNDIQQLISDLNLSSYVHILPYTSNPYKFMRIALALVLPSLYEGFPIVLSEAASLSIPVIGSDKAIPVEIFDNKEDWEKYTYKNTTTKIDFSTKICNDDICLFHLVDNFLKNTNSSTEWNKAVKCWNARNSKENQFNSYLELINEY